MTVKERIAYLRGLIEGSAFLGKDPQAKAIWENLLDICDGLADAVQELEDEQEETQEHVEAIDCDLTDLEAEVYGYEDEDDIDGGDMVEMECPNCGEEVYFEEEFLYDSDIEVSCPGCGTVVYATGESAMEECNHQNGTAGDSPDSPGDQDDSDTMAD